MWWNKNKCNRIRLVVVAVILAAAFWYSGKAPGVQNWNVENGGAAAEGKPLTVKPQDVPIGTSAYTCTISISCATILDHMDLLDAEKTDLVPEDGWILPATTVTFYGGESVLQVLRRTCKLQKIHMESGNTPIYSSTYIKGIDNLYEFECGQLSSWMYKVNDEFPDYDCSHYPLKDGDVICWEYTCDLGVDIGSNYSTGG